MKIKCTHCHKDISNDINNQLNGYNIGRVNCSHCHKINKRYLSEFDNILYFIFTSIYYSLAIFFIFMIYHKFNNYIAYGMIAIVFALSFFVLKNVGLYIYDHAFFKEELKDIDLKQDKNRTKSLRLQSLAFVAFSFMYGVDKEFIGYYFMLLGGFIIIMVLKAYFCLKKEKE